MSENPLIKKRKLNASPNKPPLSAVAARKALKSTTSSQSKQNGDAIPRILGLTVESSTTSVAAPARLVDSLPLKATETVEVRADASYSNETPTESEDSQASIYLSRAKSLELVLERPSIGLSNFKPDKVNVHQLAGGTISLRLEPGERLVILGLYEISIRKGQVTLMGATLLPSKTFYSVFASSSHALPVVRCLGTDIDGADIRLRPCNNGLNTLHSLSPLFGKLWNDDCGPLGSEYPQLLVQDKKSTFQILFSSKDGPQKSFLQPLISPPTWNEALAKCSIPFDQKPRSIMICGPKSSGKSTFAKLLVNRLLSVALEGLKSAKGPKSPGVGLLDLDPGQPEYSPPGQLSLVHVQEPNFGPPFAHPIPSLKSNILRSHSLGALSPSMDPDLYMSCALDLFTHYRNLLSKSPNCPLVINTPGWVLGTGLEILVDLIAKVRPTEVIYMSKDGPPEVVEALGEVNAQIPVLTLLSQASEYTTRTAAHLRTMQYMSYFHLGQPDQKGLAWNTQPLTSMPPWEIRYSGENPGILGVMCYGEQPPASLVAETINGSLVAVVVIDDMTAIPGCGSEGQNKPNDEEKMQLEEKDLEANTAGVQPPVQPLILHTPEKIPYFNPSNTNSLNPKKSHSIGLALVRGIDTDRRRIQILTPISPSTIQDINNAGKSIILVSGKLDTPGWAYIEELTQKIALEKLERINESTGVEVDEDDEDGEDADSVVEGNSKKASSSLDDGFKNAPWIERLEGSQGRGIGSRVWRVRRDLGRDGGD